MKIERPLPDDSSAPEPYYIQPFAEAAADVVLNKTLEFISPSHLHTHDYLISTNNSFQVVVGEVESAGSSTEDERMKSMTGVLRVLNVYDHAIDMISGTWNHEIGFHKVTTQRGSGGLTYPVISSRRLNIIRPTAEDEYTNFIMAVLEALECVFGFWMQKYYGKTCKSMPGTYPTLQPEGDEFTNIRVNVPGVYLGDNITWAHDCRKVMLDLFCKGCHNEENDIAYLFKTIR